MRWLAWLVLTSLGGCVQSAVLENDVRNAQWKSRTLATASDLSLAHAALSAQLVELEALYQRDARDQRVRELLDHGYRLMGRGFVELRRVQAVAAGESARAAREARARADAEARARFYRGTPTPSSRELPSLGFEKSLTAADLACRRHERAAYEQALNALLLERDATPEGRLEQALLRELAAAWLTPNLAARCAF